LYDQHRFERDVGQRTNITVLNQGLSDYVRGQAKGRALPVPMTAADWAARAHGHPSGALLLTGGGDDREALNVLLQHNTAFNATRVLSESALFRRELNVWWPAVYKSLGGTRSVPSTGLKAILFAFTMCSHVSLYGFLTPQSTGRTRSRYHYWDSAGTAEYVTPARRTSPHNMTVEHLAIESIVRSKALRLCPRSRDGWSRRSWS